MIKNKEKKKYLVESQERCQIKEMKKCQDYQGKMICDCGGNIFRRRDKDIHDEDMCG